DAGPGITAPFNSHGVAAADFDNDGALEILVNNSHDVPSLLKNYGEHGNWISLKLVGTKSNRDAIGALVTVNSGGHQQVQEVRSGGSYISQRDFRLHFGLGKSTEAESVEVRWPSGVRQVFHDVDADTVWAWWASAFGDGSRCRRLRSGRLDRSLRCECRSRDVLALP